jgi:hypothetical protein
MKATATLLFLAAVTCSLATAAAQGVLLREDFESGAPGWTFGDIWHIEPDTTVCGSQVAPFPSPGHCAWYGGIGTSGTAMTCDTSTGHYLGAGLTLTTPILVPPTSGSVALRYRRYLDSQHCSKGYDVSIVRVTANGGQTELTVAPDCSFEQGWIDHRVDLSAFAGTAVQVQFKFIPDLVFSFFGWCIDDIEIVDEPGVVACVAGPACPCFTQWNHPALANTSEDSGGCKHPGQVEARLFGNGVQSVSADSVELVVHDLPLQTVVVYLQGAPSSSTPFGDGRMCMTGPLRRLAVRSVSSQADAYPHAGEAGIALVGSVPPAGGTRAYQVAYRDAQSWCTPATFTISNSYVVGWRP